MQCKEANESKHVLTSPLHALVYEIECNHRADHAEEIIDPKFRPKDTYLQALHYCASTNLALIQSSMTYLYEKRGPEYHWILDLFQRMGLPILDGMKQQVCGSFHVKSTQKNPYPHRFERNLVFTQCLLRLITHCGFQCSAMYGFRVRTRPKIDFSEIFCLPIVTTLF